MRVRWFYGAGLFLGAIFLVFLFRWAPWSASAPRQLQQVPPVEQRSSKPLPEKKLEYTLQKTPRSVVHILKIPTDAQFVVMPAVDAKLKTVEDFASQYKAIAAINGGYFDPANQKSTSAVIVQGDQVAKPEDNERLMGNPDLLPYLDKILNRSEFRRYLCSGVMRYDIALRQDLPPVDCSLEDAVGAGPQLLPNLNLEAEGFQEIRDGKVVRDAIASNQPNARSAIGITRDGSIVWVVAAQASDRPTNSGMTLPELAELMKKLDVEKAMNLDGGSSSSMYYQGETFYGKVDPEGQPISRPIKSVLLVQFMKKPGS